MEKKDCKSMSNAQLKIYLETLNNEFESTKAKISKLVEILEDINSEYANAENELNIRKNVYL